MATETSKAKGRAGGVRIWDRRLLPAAALSLASSFLLLFYAPLEIYCNNSGEFWFSLAQLTRVMLPAFLIAFLLLTALSALILRLGARAYTVFLVLFSTAFFSVYIQGTFFAGDLPPLDGNVVDWSRYAGQRVVSFVIIALCLAAVLLALRFLGREKWGIALCWVGGGMTLMLAVTLATVCLTTGAYKVRYYELSTDDEMLLSQDKNFIILMMDAVDAEVFSRVLADHPEYGSGVLRDFTCYENVLTGYPATRYSVPMFLSGEWYEGTESNKEYFSRCFRESPFLLELERQGYALNFYSDAVPYDFYPQLSNMYPISDELEDTVGLVKKELRLVGFRYAPFSLKPRFRFDALDFNTLRSKEHLPYIPTTANLDFDDALDSRPIERSESRRFKFIHLDGAHGPFDTTVENGKLVRLPDGQVFTDGYEETEACLFLLEKYTALLREQGLYDNSVIVVMSDHGQHTVEDGSTGEVWLLKRADPIFLVKGFGERHANMAVSDMPISFIELSGAFRKLLDGAEGDALFDPRPADTVRRYFTVYDGNLEDLTEYAQVGSPSDISTFTAVGRISH